MISLVAGEWQAELRPEIGGALGALRRGGVDVLRPTPADASDPLQTACFPLVPYCNRIRAGRFTFADREVQLPLNFLPERNSLHGLGWQVAWQIERQSTGEALLVHAHDGSGGWPWAYRAEQSITLDPGGCTVSLSVTNLSNGVMPAGLGLHPYFRRLDSALVQFSAGSVLLGDDENMPTGERAPGDHFAPWSKGASLPAATVDHAHADWDGIATIRDELGGITLSASATPHLHVYTPAGGDPLCLEPVTHLPDALNHDAAGMALLHPGERTSISMRIEATLS